MSGLQQASAYGWLMLAGIFVSIILWSRLAKRDERLVLIYLAALAGACDVLVIGWAQNV